MDGNGNTIKFIGRIMANAYYDFQRVRIDLANQIRDVVRKKIEGIPFDAVEDKKENNKNPKRYTDDQLKMMWDGLLNQEKINKREHDYLMACWDNMNESKNLEKKYQRKMLKYVSSEPVHEEFLGKIRGFGPVLSANVIKEFGNCSKYDTVSRLWAHCGGAVINGKAPSRKKGESTTYSPKLKTLMWKISDSLLKLNKGYYRQVYDVEKERQLGKKYPEGYLHELYPQKKKNGKHVYPKDATKLKLGHAHNRALRKTWKIFLDHYWHASRELAGLPAEKNYVEGILHHDHVITWKKALSMEGNGQEP